MHRVLFSWDDHPVSILNVSLSVDSGFVVPDMSDESSLPDARYRQFSLFPGIVLLPLNTRNAARKSNGAQEILLTICGRHFHLY
jgi:hypothetical protein